ncbi:oxidoreductase [Denitratisoma oestradiolicum]|uniref:Putative quinone oxidoreductase YhfP n=1 Tax=Denitratisoma oestradiolicum TaxID=311182 RepID=A0A6S6Y2X3_9PROT|nr:oxidoreductase [Denitratisoma oestradiolicum]TWO79935.1 oxidoreductase [Denitratisoma oestradiolicum]CAB1369693.1 putative quinone oxidoreductase YhfP [Denitratisoma oestradiolicum]
MTFQAFLSSQDDGKVLSRFVQMDDAQLDPGEVSIRVAYSDVNYKDALSATGAGKIIRRFPCVGGIDLSGTVTDSSDGRFRVGDEVLCTSYDLGVAHHGGYAERARVPADWVVKLPAGLSLFDAMAYGTAGFTAALAVVRMEANGLTPASGPVLVTGATGGVGSVAIAILAKLGYRVVALTGKAEETEYLKGLGAAEVMLRSSLDLGRIKPLDKAIWAGAVDNLGGPVLAWLASTMQIGGTLASVGLAADTALNTTVMPFILRGVSLLGVDSVNCPMPQRAEVWRRLASDMHPDQLSAMTRCIEFSQLPDVFEAFLQARVKGRTVVRINP